MSDYVYKVDPANRDANIMGDLVYRPLAVDYHYRLEWDLAENVAVHAERHQVRYFDQGGEEGHTKFSEMLEQMQEAQRRGMIEHLSAASREVRLDDWELGWPTLTPTLTQGNESV